MGSEHTQYTPDHHHDYHDCDEDVHVGNDDDDDGEANDHHVDGRFAISLFGNIYVGKMRNTYYGQDKTRACLVLSYPTWQVEH